MGNMKTRVGIGTVQNAMSATSPSVHSASNAKPSGLFNARQALVAVAVAAGVEVRLEAAAHLPVENLQSEDALRRVQYVLLRPHHQVHHL